MTEVARPGVVSQVQVNFVRQQGFKDASTVTCGLQYPALMVQPRVIGIVVLVGAILQVPWLFVVLSVVLWWNALVPRLNPFDAAYNILVADRRARLRLTPAPAPRRFAQALAATMALSIAAALFTGRTALATGFELFLLAAIAALVFGGFCFGSFVFHLITGSGGFAMRTLPWRDASSKDSSKPT